jgi:ABC-type sugar transport system substrate-binding protein
MLAAAVLAAVLVPSAAQAQSVTIRVTSILVSLKTTDVEPKGVVSRGDHNDYRNVLRNAVAQFGKAKGARVGSDSGRLTFTGAHTARYSGTARLPDGTLIVRGTVRSVGKSLQYPVVGGTGRYASARGTLTVGTGDERAPNVYRLVLHVTVA